MRRLLFLALSVVLLTGCKHTEYVTVERVHTDTLRETRYVLDSIYVHDSVYVHEYLRGDTVYVDRAVWHIAYKDRLLIDTVYESRVDSVPVPFPFPEYVEKELTWWQKLRLWLGNILLVAIGGFVVYAIIKLKFS